MKARLVDIYVGTDDDGHDDALMLDVELHPSEHAPNVFTHIRFPIDADMLERLHVQIARRRAIIEDEAKRRLAKAGG